MAGGSYQPHAKAAACFQQAVLRRNNLPSVRLVPKRDSCSAGVD